MLRRIVLLFSLVLWTSYTIGALPAFCAGTSIVVPSKSIGNTDIPLPYDLNYKGFAFLNKPPTCNVSYEPDALDFTFTVPIKTGYKPKGATLRDGDIFGDDRIELYLKVDDSSPYSHYAVSAMGTIADDKMHDRNWNGTATYTVQMEQEHWVVLIKIPYVDFGFDPANGTSLKALVAAYSGEPGNSFYRSSVSVPIDFAGAAFQSFVISPTLPFAEKVTIGNVVYDLNGKGSLPVEYQIKNPGTQAVTVDIASQKTEIPGESSRTVSEKIQLGDGKLSKVTLSVEGVLNSDVEIKNEIIPRIDLTAIDWYNCNVVVYNQKNLEPYVKNVVVSIDGKKRLECPLIKLSFRKINLKDLKPGPHEMVYSFLNKSGKVFISQTKTINIYEPERIASDVSQIDVSKYYKSVGYESSRVTLTRSRFDLSNGIFPKQIAVDSRVILDKPVQLLFDGKVLPTIGKVEVVSKNKNQVVLKSVSQCDGKTITVTADHRYDGFVWYDVEISGKERFEYKALDVLIPLKLDEDILLTHDAAYPDATFKKAPADPAILPTTSQVLPYGRLLKSDETTTLPLASYVGLATDTNEEYRGLFFCNEGPRGWNVRNYDQTYKIQRTGDLASLTVKISDGQKRLKQKTIKFGFGLMPVPMREDIKNFHEYYRMDVQNWVLAYKPRNGEQYSYLQQIAWNGIKIALAHESWAEYESYWKAGLNENHMQSYAATAKAAGLKTIFYFGFLISNLIPEFAVYHDLFITKPNSYPDFPFTPYAYYAQGDPDQGAYGVCYNSVFGDFFAKGIIDAVHHYDLNGVFFDGGLGTLSGCTNVKHGCGTIDPYGRLVPTFPIRQFRSLMEYVYNNGNKKDPGFIIDNHFAWPGPALMGLMSSYWTGECSIFFEPQSRTDPGALRAMMNGKLYGIPCDLLRRPETDWNTAWAQGLLVNAYPRLIAMNTPQLNQRMWGLYDQYQLTSDTFTPYFSKKNKVIKDNPNVFVSYYNTDKALVVVVSNYWNDTPQEINLNLSAFKGLKSKCKDVWNNADYELVNSKVKMTVDAKLLRLIVIER